MTAFAIVLGALEARLKASPVVTAQIDRAKLKPLPESRSEAVVIRIDTAIGDRFAIQGGPTDWDTTVHIECYARSRTLTPDAAVDALLGRVWARIAQDTTLGNVVGDINPTELNFDFANEAEQLSCVTLTLKVMHRTQNQSLE